MAAHPREAPEQRQAGSLSGEAFQRELYCVGSCAIGSVAFRLQVVAEHPLADADAISGLSLGQASALHQRSKVIWSRVVKRRVWLPVRQWVLMHHSSPWITAWMREKSDAAS